MNCFRYTFLSLILLLSTFGISAQSLVECGNVQSDSLSIPSYRFIVVDKNGKQFEDLHAVGVVEMQTWVWGHSYGDWNWEDENLAVAVPVSFDRKEGVYVSKAIPKLKIRDTGSRKYPCLDRLKRFYIGFTLGGEFNETNGFAGGFGISLFRKPLEQITFPNPTEPLKITLKSWGGAKEP